MRIAVAEVVQETGSFSPMVADLQDFEAYGLFFGDEIYERLPDAGPLGGFREVALKRAPRSKLLPLVRAWAGAGGIITEETFRFLLNELETRLRAALPVDAVWYSLHGAAASETDDDVEGALLELTREIVGPRVPVVVAVDHHANITARMVKHATALVGHETQPHDPKATGVKAAHLLFDALESKTRPVIAWKKIPMITPQDQFLTSSGPMKQWFDRARDHERQPGVLDVSPYPMQPWLDVKEGGWAVVVHTSDHLELAESIAREMAQLAWDLRAEFWRSERLRSVDAVRKAAAAEGGLFLLSDTGDSVYGGAPGDSTALLKAILEVNPEVPTFVPLVDVRAVDAAVAAGVGNEVSLSVGADVATAFHQPVAVKGRVVAASQGLTLLIPERGVCEVGKAAVLAIGAVRLVLLAERTFAINHPVLYSSLGLDVDAARMVVMKTASNFQFFQKWNPTLLRCDTPGTTQSDLRAFDWKRTPRPIYGLDEAVEWSASPAKE